MTAVDAHTERMAEASAAPRPRAGASTTANAPDRAFTARSARFDSRTQKPVARRRRADDDHMPPLSTRHSFRANHMLRLALSLTIAGAIAVHAQRSAAPGLDSAAHAIVRDFAARWRTANAHGLSDLFALDADLVIPTGEIVAGRPAIRAFYDGVFKAGYAGSQSGGDVVRLRSLAPDLGIVDATWFITGARTPAGGPQPAERGVLTAILRHDGDAWRIVALREQTSATTLTLTGTGGRK